MEIRTVYVDRYGYVQVREDGKLVIGKTGKPISLHWRNHDGYVLCRLSAVENGKKKRINRLVHRMVAEAFIPNPNNYPEVNHIDGNKENNAASNLEWCTRQQNMKHAVMNGLIARQDGEYNGRHLVDMETAIRIRKLADQGYTRYAIAKALDIGWTTVDHIIKRDTWNY